MKAKRRHELQHNVLDSELGKIAGFLKKYGTYLAWAALAAALVFLVVSYVRNQSRGAQLDLQNAYYRATSDTGLTPEDRLTELKTLADQDRNRPLAATACLMVANEYAARRLALGPATPPDEITARADNARKYYLQVVDRHAAQPMAVARARVGLARLAETQRDFEEAARQYKAVLAMADLEAMPVFECAREGLESLSTLSRPARMATTAPASQPTSAASAPAKAG